MNWRRREPEAQADDLLVEGEAVQPVMVDYNMISMYMNRTPVGELGCGANILLLIVAGGFCVGVSHLYAFVLTLVGR
jgi:hypothetical protein